MRKMTKIFNKDEGFTGLEAAIVLIAFVVVAAVFSYVVLGAGFFTTQKAQQVIYTSVDQASSSVEIMGDVYGINFSNTPPEAYTYIRFTVGLTSGGSPVDFSQTTMAYSAQKYNGVEYLNRSTYTPKTKAEDLTNQVVIDAVGAAGSGDGKWGVLLINNGGDKTDLLLENQEQFVIYARPSQGLVANEKFNLEISPSVGTSYVVARKAPARVEKVDVLY
jgi:flagellin FlaB